MKIVIERTRAKAFCEIQRKMMFRGKWCFRNRLTRLKTLQIEQRPRDLKSRIICFDLKMKTRRLRSISWVHKWSLKSIECDNYCSSHFKNGLSNFVLNEQKLPWSTWAPCSSWCSIRRCALNFPSRNRSSIGRHMHRTKAVIKFDLANASACVRYDRFREDPS